MRSEDIARWGGKRVIVKLIDGSTRSGILFNVAHPENVHNPKAIWFSILKRHDGRQETLTPETIASIAPVA